MSVRLKISIIMPVKNGAVRLERALDSVAAQDWPHELIVMDGASSDGTLDILKRRHSEIALMVSEPDESATIALNKGAAQASGDIISMLMSDDVLAPDALKAIGETFAEHPTLDVVSGGALLIDERTNGTGVTEKISGDSLTLELDRILATPYPAAYFFKKEIWENLQGLSMLYRYGADRDLLMRCKLAGVAHQSIAAPVYHYSMNEGSDTLVEKPEVIKAFLTDHCVMANEWLQAPGLEDAERKRIRGWRRQQVMELAVRHVQLGDWRAASRVIGAETAHDPLQILTSLKWIAGFGTNAVHKKVFRA